MRFNLAFRKFLWTTVPIITKLDPNADRHCYPEWSEKTTTFAPHTDRLARTLSAVHPDLVEEVVFVLNEQLNVFERAERTDCITDKTVIGYTLPDESAMLFCSFWASREPEPGNNNWEKDIVIWAYLATVAQMLLRFCDFYGGRPS